jgi:predicted dehydrogenase
VRVLILGLSNIAQRRVVPALQSVGGFAAIHVATRQARDDAAMTWPHGTVYDDYSDALARSGAELAYVSLVNSEHGRWTDAALRNGMHVVVDKPAMLSLAETEQLLELAAQRGVCLAEANVVGYHPQVSFLKAQFDAAGSAPTRISATLSFPPMDPTNFRYRRDLGGGALWDLGPYAGSIGRLFYGEEPEQISCEILARGAPDDVDVAFSMLATYSGGRSVVGHFGFDTVYRNRVDVIGPELGAEMDRFFTAVPEVGGEVRVTTKQGTSTLTAPAGDSFAHFFRTVRDAIEGRCWGDLADDLHADARTLHRLRQSAEEPVL